MEEKRSTKLCYFEKEGTKYIFEKNEDNNMFIDIKDYKERNEFVHTIAELEGGGIENDGSKGTYKNALDWVINSELPLIINNTFTITRIKSISCSQVPIGEKIEFSTKEEALSLAQENSKRFMEYCNKIEEILKNEYHFSDSELKDEQLANSMVLAYINDVPVDVFVNDIID